MQKYAVSSCYLGTIQSALEQLQILFSWEISCRSELSLKKKLFPQLTRFCSDHYFQELSFILFSVPAMHQSALEGGVCSRNEKKSTVEQLLWFRTTPLSIVLKAQWYADVVFLSWHLPSPPSNNTTSFNHCTVLLLQLGSAFKCGHIQNFWPE